MRKTIETDTRIRVEAPLKVEPWKESAVRKLNEKAFLKEKPKELLVINNLRRLIMCFGGKLLLVNWKRIKSWAERGRSRMRVPIRWHVTSGNVSSEVPVGLHVSVKSVGVCDVVVLKDDALSGLLAGGSRCCTCGAQSAIIKLVLHVI